MTPLGKQLILDCAYRWRSSEIHAAACRLGVREDVSGDAEAILEERLMVLRCTLDTFKPEYGEV